MERQGSAKRPEGTSKSQSTIAGGTSEGARNQVASPKPPPQSWQRTMETIQSRPPPKAPTVLRTDNDGDDVRSTHAAETHPDATSSDAPSLKARPMIQPEGLTRPKSTALDRTPKYLPHISGHRKARIEAWLEAAKIHDNFDAENMPLFLVNSGNYPSELVEAWREFVHHPIQWKERPDGPGIPRPTESRTMMGPPPYHQIVFCHCYNCRLEWPVWCAPMNGCHRCYSGLLPGMYAGQIMPATGNFKVYPQYQDVALIAERYLEHNDIIILLRNARIPRSNVPHDQKKHTLIKKYFDLAPDPPSRRQILLVRFLERQCNFVPCADVFESFDSMQQYIHNMWPGGERGANMWTNFLDGARSVIRNPNSLIVPAAVETHCTES